MRTEKEMYDLILGVAKDDNRVRAVDYSRKKLMKMLSWYVDINTNFVSTIPSLMV